VVRSREHVIYLCLKPEVRFALMAKAAREKISMAYQAHLYVIEGLYRDGLLDEETYHYLRQEYSKPKLRHEPKPTPQDNSEEKLAEKREIYRMVIEQWLEHDEKWREYWIRKAENDRDIIPEANEILKMAKRINVEGEIEIDLEAEKNASHKCPVQDQRKRLRNSI